jgi:hypothetical protein
MLPAVERWVRLPSPLVASKETPVAKDELETTDQPLDKDAKIAEPVEDTEGHSLGLLLGLGALDQARGADQRARDRKNADEDLRLAREARTAREPKKA